MILALLLAVAPPPPLPPQEAQLRPVATGSDSRAQRPWVVSGEAGWNGLAGLGVTVARHLAPHVTLEAGLGLSAEGAKVGVRGRYNFSLADWTPFVGAGFLYGVGDAAQVDDTGPRVFTYRIEPSPYLQLVAGAEYQSGGFNFLAAAGYARLLGKNITVLAGAPTEDDLAPLRIATGSGPAISLSLGHAF